MHQAVETLCLSLEEISNAILNGTTESRRLPDFTGSWAVAPLTRIQISEIPGNLARWLRVLSPEEVEDVTVQKLVGIGETLAALKQNIIPHLYTGNGPSAAPALLGTLQYVTSVVSYEFGFEDPADRGLIPAQVLRKSQKFKQELEAVGVNKDELTQKVNQIEKAYAAAEELPLTVQHLDDAKAKLSETVKSSVDGLGEVKAVAKEAESLLDKLREHSIESKQILQQCEEAYRASTSKGLAAAFEAKSKSLVISMWVWVGVLVVALGIGGYLGFVRVHFLNELLASGNAGFGSITAQLILTGLSVGAPVWLAWLSTKQIGQRFRLVEDYAFKSSVAKAYEGYRREAARIDPEFEKRLFS